MALGRNPRLVNRRSSSYCSTTVLVVFVAICLVGVWMMRSSTIDPADISSSQNNSDIKEQVSGSDSKRFEGHLGDVPEDDMKGDTNSKANIDANESRNESSADKNPVKTNEERMDGSVDRSETNTDSGNKESDQYEIKEKNSKETINNKQEKRTDQISEERANNEQTKKSADNSDKTAGNGQQQSNTEKGSGEEGKSDGDIVQEENNQGKVEKVDQSQDKDVDQSSGQNKNGNRVKNPGSNEVFPDGAQSDLLNETDTHNGVWSTQTTESNNEKEIQSSLSSKGQMVEYNWKLCNVTAGADYIPCLDNEKAIKNLLTNMHYEHRERHCPEEAPTCLVRLPDGYKQPIQWPTSRDKIWYSNTPYTQLSVVKASQNWVKVTGEFLTFPGGGTQFKNGALHYIDKIQEALPDIAWGKQSRTILDVGCGVASFGGYLFERDVLTMSFAPKDEHEAQVQFALERGIPAISAVMGTKRLPFPGQVFDVIHCARCRVPWHIEGGMLLLELNRLLRPGGYFVWSATPVYQKLKEDIDIWNAMSSLTKSMCWKMVSKTKDKLNHVGFAIYRKPSDNTCYEQRIKNSPPLCRESDDPNAAWNVPLQACIHRLSVDPSVRGSQWPEQWPLRLGKIPYWLNNSQVGVYGKPVPEDFEADYEHWKHVVSNSYLNGLGISWFTVRNVMDMRAVYGGFAAALRDMKLWVMNVISIDSPDTLPIIYERGLFGMYHDWCESFSTYPRTYDLLHADHLFSKLKKRCKLLPVIAEVDRILRPEGKLVVRDDAETISQLQSMAKSLHWEIRLTYSKDNEGLLCVQKTMWRPEEVESSTLAMS